MNEILEQALLFDFYGELLTEHQKEIYEDFILNDLSLGEIAQEEGISRQGVSDLVKRCTKKLSDYERKLHLVEKFISVKQDVERIRVLSEAFSEQNKQEVIREIREISNQIIEEL